jgi:hypothetical protein
MNRFFRSSLIAGGAIAGPIFAVHSQDSHRIGEGARGPETLQRWKHSCISPAYAYCDEAPTNHVSRNAANPSTLATLSRRASKSSKGEDGEEKLLLIAGSAHPALSKEIADNLEVSIAQASIARFADGMDMYGLTALF